MSVVDLIGIRVIDAGAVVVPALFMYAVGRFGFRGRKLRWTRGPRGSRSVLVSSREPERREWLAVTTLTLLSAATVFISLILMGVPLS